jgi:hypothetical protein
LKSVCVNYPLLLEHAFVIFDADVDASITEKIKDKHSFLVLPDPENIAIERRIVHFIMTLPNGHEFFVNFKKERDTFLGEFSSAGISLTAIEVLDENKVPIKDCKKWADQNPAAFKKYVTYYCGKQLQESDFADQFLKRINKINTDRGLPLVEK